MSYESIQLPKPSVFEGTALNSNVLIIASGHSTKSIVDKKDQLRKHFDKIIVCNYAFEFFDEIADFHIVAEKTSKTSTNYVYKKLSEGNFRTDLPRIVNWKGIEMYPERYNLIKTARSNFGGKPDIRKYAIGSNEGLLIGDVGSQSFSLGSILLCAMHFAGMIGASSIYMIGADLCFKDEYDHFYKDSVYREPPKIVKKKNAHKIIDVDLSGKTYKTTLFFKESAECISSSIATFFKGIRIVDFSDGLIVGTDKQRIAEHLK